MSWNGLKIGRVLSTNDISEQKSAAFLTNFLDAGGGSSGDPNDYDDEEFTAEEEIFTRLFHLRNALDTAKLYSHHQHTLPINGITNGQSPKVEAQDDGDMKNANNGEEKNNMTPEMRKKMKKEAKEQKKAAKKEKKRKRRESKETAKSVEKKPKLEEV
uniref:Uncharacterized protein n=1 Tax=Asterionellopsis glacialis TaxID=33640 RepID=A0A7S0KY46_9STRA|mmetsp:Transcript_534/g.793  ORF Transcript_534/g.793 Transcript_534/m.793 type:complete len:158 (+) Transcript_534:166-639(+)